MIFKNLLDIASRNTCQREHESKTPLMQLHVLSTPCFAPSLQHNKEREKIFPLKDYVISLDYPINAQTNTSFSHLAEGQKTLLKDQNYV